ncbi:MAG TPA: hypothetical protein ENJ22_02450 [Gammaproteobacteria bacterium]|nr:hypothetical protein [Gammaproteobacteria bacterium]
MTDFRRSIMKTTIHKHSRRILAFVFATTFFNLANTATHAAPGTLSQVPLYVGPAVEPNVVFLADDSGSMDWSLMTEEDNGLIYLSGWVYYYSHPAPGNDFFWVLASEEYLDSTLGVDPATSGVWRARNSDYNKLYYNPEVTYTPWKGVDSNGATYTDANPNAAPVDPYDPGAGTVNLTALTSYFTDYPGFGGFTVTNFYPARYYAWTDDNGNGIVDVGDTHTLVEITSNPTPMTPSPPGNYTGGPNRTDCAAAPSCTYAEEIQNFANWFTYYRSRELTTKNAISKATVDLTGVRIGYGTLHNNNNVNIKVASMNLDPATGSKRTFFDSVFNTRPSGGTPLRHRLKDVGQYFECSSHNFFGASGSDCPILPASEAGMCQKNATIMMTDGFYNGTLPTMTPSNTDGDDNTTFDGPPYADGYSNTLADVAMHFYERDLAPGLSDDVPFQPGDKDQAPHQHMVTYTVAFGVSGTLDPATDDPTSGGFSWPNPASGDPQKVDDLWHAAYNGRGEFYSAQDPEDLIQGLQEAFAAASKGQSSAAAVAFNTTTLDTGSVVYQAKFNPSDNWKGELVALNLGVDGSLSSTAWNAGDALDTQSPNSRVILTSDGSTGIPFQWTSLTTAQKNDLRTNPSGGLDNTTIGEARVDYIRGDRSDEGSGNNFRLRSGVLGDIVHSNPVYVGKVQSDYEDFAFADSTYTDSFKTMNRPGVIYVGGNDGMLHGFWESDGTEALAYIPNMLYSTAAGEGLHYLTDPDYAHRYYVDLSPTVADVNVGGWKTVLIGGYRAGGRGLFALDVTDPTQFSEANAANIFLWEFTSNDDNDLGYTFSKPTMALMENDKWAAIFGNGYNDLGDGEAKLFIYYLDGSGYEEITTGAGSPGSRNGLSTPAVVDFDGNGKADRVYAGDLEGNLWAFDLSSTGSNLWQVAYKSGSTPTPLFTASISGTAQPITSRPVVARHPTQTLNTTTEPNLLVFFGTGQYIVDGDKGSTSTQTFYGIWDNGPNGSAAPYDRNDLVAQTLEANSTTDIRVPTNNTVSYPGELGWYFDLPTSGERVVVNPKIRGDYVFFNTLIPDPSSCSSQGYGWLMALRIVDGGRPEEPVFDVNNDGVVDEDDLIDGSDAPGGVRLEGIPAGSNFLSNKMYTPDDNGNIDIRTIDVGGDNKAGRISWREVTQ